MSSPPLEYPPLIDLPADPWHWPKLPGGWPHQPLPELGLAQPCVVESLGGKVVEGELLAFDAAAQQLRFRSAPNGRTVLLAFTRFSRLTLSAPMRMRPGRHGSVGEPLPAATLIRDYELVHEGGGARLVGRTAGHVETDEGLYLFPPLADEASLCRVFVPRSSYTRHSFGPTAAERAASQWIDNREELLTALELQDRRPVLPLGRSLLALGLVTPQQLERALAHPDDNRPVGETLVASGEISRAELRQAIAHKMGYPLVDLSRFPIDMAAVNRLPRALAVGFRAVPLCVDQGRLIVAVDKPSRAGKLQALHAFAELRVVGVLAPRTQVLAALQRLSANVWTQHAPDHAPFFPTTI